MRKLILLLILAAVGGYFYHRANIVRPDLIIGSECNYIPNNWEERGSDKFNVPIINHDGYYADGYDIQIAKYIAEKIGYNLKVKKFQWGYLLTALNNGEVDAVFSAMTDTEDRKNIAAFTNVYGISKPEYGIIVNTKSKYSNAEKLEDFYGSNFATTTGSILDFAMKQIPGAHRRFLVPTLAEMLDKVLKGEADAAVVKAETGRAYDTAYENLRFISFPEGEGFVLGFNGVCAALRLKDKKRLEDFNNALDSLTTKEKTRIMDQVISRSWKLPH